MSSVEPSFTTITSNSGYVICCMAWTPSTMPAASLNAGITTETPTGAADVSNSARRALRVAGRSLARSRWETSTMTKKATCNRIV